MEENDQPEMSKKEILGSLSKRINENVKVTIKPEIPIYFHGSHVVGGKVIKVDEEMVVIKEVDKEIEILLEYIYRIDI